MRYNFDFERRASQVAFFTTDDYYPDRETVLFLSNEEFVSLRSAIERFYKADTKPKETDIEIDFKEGFRHGRPIY